MKQQLNSLNKRLKAVERVRRGNPTIRVFIADDDGLYTTTINGQEQRGTMDELEALLPPDTDNSLDIHIMIPESDEDDED